MDSLGPCSLRVVARLGGLSCGEGRKGIVTGYNTQV